MRNDIGMSTIGQRIAGLASLRTTLQPQAPTAPASSAGAAATASATNFADSLADQLGALSATGSAGASGTGGGTGGWQMLTGADLGPGVGLQQGASLLTPSQGTVPGLLTGPHPGGCACSTHGQGAAVSGVGAGTGGVGAADHDGHVHTPPVLDRSGPPAELQAYGNGRIPADALAPLGVGDHRLWAPAGRAFTDMLAAAQADGITIGINSSYRSYEGQVEMVERYGLYSQGGRAAAPGTSNHGWGLSVDLSLDDAAQDWMRANAADYGFVEDVPREPWHWTFAASSY